MGKRETGPGPGQSISPFGWRLSILQEQYVKQDFKKFLHHYFLLLFSMMTFERVALR